MRGGWTVVAMVLGGMAAGLLALETGLRAWSLYDPGFGSRTEALAESPITDWVSHPFLPYIARPNSSWTRSEGDYQTQVTINSWGFRAHEFPTTKSPADYFVVCLGESTTWGQIAPSNAQTWPELLEAKLQRIIPEKRVQVFNLGLSGATSTVSVASLATIAIHLQPDLVIAYHGFNEWGAARALNFRTDHAHFYNDLVAESAWLGFRQDLPDWARSSFALVRIAAMLDTVLQVKSFLDETTREVEGFERDSEVAVARLVANLRTLDSIARGHGAKALFSTFQYFTPAVPPYPVNELLRRMLPEANLEFADIDAAIPDGQRHLQIDDCLFTDAGRKLVAQAFFDRIVALGLLN